MIKNDADKQKHFKESIKKYEDNIASLIKKEAAVIAECRKEPDNAALKLFALSNDMLDLTSNYLVINGVSCSVFNSKDDIMLNEARKSLFKAIIYIENVVTGKVDVTFSEYEKNLAELNELTFKKKYEMVIKIGLTLSMLQNALGDNTKWKWAFVEVEGRYAAIVKNLFDFKAGYAKMDPTDSDYEIVVLHFRLIKDLLGKASERYRERFDLSTKKPEDLSQAIDFLGALHKACIVMGERGEAEEIMRKYKNWEAAYEGQLKRVRTATTGGA